MLNRTAPNQITLNRTILSQTKACIAKSLCVVEKGEQSTIIVNGQYIFFTLSILKCFKKVQCFESRLCFNLQAKKHLTWQTPQPELFSVTGHHRKSKLKICT